MFYAWMICELGAYTELHVLKMALSTILSKRCLSTEKLINKNICDVGQYGARVVFM